MLYGRDEERSRIWKLLEGARASRSGALVLRGEAGIGKTALLENARERAGDMHVLTARGVESESELPFAALHQLLRPALGELQQLPLPQTTALRGALGLADGIGQERFIVFTACLSLLSEIAERRPVLCLVDDAHWLDAASADALGFVARRQDAEGIVILFAAREGDVRVFEAADLPSLQLAGLGTEAAAALLALGAGVDAAPFVRDRLVEQTRGNALALMELPSALTADQLAGHQPLPEALPLTHQLESVYLERVRRLPGETQQLLLAAAADDSESMALVSGAAQLLGAGPRALDPAEQADLVAVHGMRLQFHHPLVRSAVYGAATSSERRAVHRALATALAEDDANGDRRVWHLAASVVEHDELVARELEEVAERAEDRAGYMAASKALERAAQLSGEAPARGRRLVGSARAASLAGADEYAVTLAKQALPLVGVPTLQAEIARVLGLAEMQCGRPLDGYPTLLAAARKSSAADPGKALELLVYASTSAWEGGDLEAFREACTLASTIAVPGDGDVSTFIVQLLAGSGAMAEGDTARGALLLDRALEWVSASDDERHLVWAGLGAFWLGDDRRVGALLSRAISLARQHGAMGTLVYELGLRARYRLAAQQLDEAAVDGREAVELAREAGATNLVPLPCSVLAVLAAIRGEDDEARRLAAEAFELATARGLAQAAACAAWALAMIDLGRSRWAEALQRLDALADVRPGFGDPWYVTMSVPDRIEAAVRAGRQDEARKALPAFETWALHSGPDWAQPRLASCRALLTEGDEASVHFESALRLSDDGRLFDRARIQLLYGEHLRRERRRADSRVHLRAALEAFERFRAEPWAEQARVELRATGETARKRDPSTISELTAQELQIARFVADGATNKEVAAQLFLSKRTIDYHLRKIFTKLDISSRSDLIRLGITEGREPVSLPA